MWWAELQGLPKLMGELARARADWETQDRIVTAAETELSNTREYLAVREARIALGAFKTRMDVADALVRTQALEDFRADGEKKVFAGIEVKLFTGYDYDTVTLTAWAHVNNPALLTLDVKRVAKEAEGLIARLAAPITITKEPRAIIAGDLGSYLVENVDA